MYDTIMPPSRLDRAVDAAISEHNAAFLLTVCRSCGGSGIGYHRTGETTWSKHACMTCGGTGDPQ